MQIKHTMALKAIGVLLFSGLALALSLFLLGNQGVQAQEPETNESESVLLNKQPTFDLTLLKKSSHSSVTSGSRITFTITITNNGPNPAQGHQFKDTPPAEMKNVVYQFSAPVISDSNTPPLWQFTDPLPVNGTIHVTVTGILTSATSITVTNVAKVSAFNSLAETPTTNNTSSAQVQIKSGVPPSNLTLYLPFITKYPPLIVAYSENFDVGRPWFEFSVDGCDARNLNGQYWITLNAGNLTCFPPAKNENKPESPYRTYGEFQVDVYHSEGASEAWYGLFINGAGGSNYYLFKIQPNKNGCTSGGNWVLIRNRNGSQAIVASGNCHPAITRGYGSANPNVIKIAHTDDRKLSLFVNSTLLHIYQDDPTNHLTGTGTGLYAESQGVNIVMKYDNFRVYKYQ